MFRCNRPTIIAHGPSVMLAGSIQLVSPCFLVPRAELGVSRVPITTALVVATEGGTVRRPKHCWPAWSPQWSWPRWPV